MAAIGQTRSATQPNVRTPLFVFGIALALVAFLVMFAFGVVFVGRTTPNGQVQVVVASEDIGARQAITPGLLTTTWLPAAAVPKNTFLHLADLSGLTAVVDIYKGQPISKNLVSANPDSLPPGTTPYLPIPAGYVALALPTSEQQGVAGHITQGDYIDVIASVNTSLFSPLNPHFVTHTVFVNVHVIGIGAQASIDTQAQKQGVASSITVVMTQCDAEYMEWLLINATLKYTLLAATDYAKEQPAAVPSCPSTIAGSTVGPKDIQARWNFTRA